MDWLQKISESLAERTGHDTASLTLDPPTRRALLDVARIAAHTSGERIYAPLLCYVLGMLAAQGVELEQSLAIVREQAALVAAEESPE